MAQETKIHILLGLFVGLLIGMNLLGGKIVDFLGVSTSVAIFMAPLTFLITDVVAETRGRRAAREFVFAGAGAILLVLFFASVFVAVEPGERYGANEAYQTVVGQSLRIMVASVIAFLLAQLHDVWAFEFWKKKTQGKLLWLRNNLSTAASQGIDTLVFMFIAFYQVSPEYTTLFILEIALPYYLLKIGFAALDTPLVYLGVRWLKR